MAYHAAHSQQEQGYRQCSLHLHTGSDHSKQHNVSSAPHYVPPDDTPSSSVSNHRIIGSVQDPFEPPCSPPPCQNKICPQPFKNPESDSSNSKTASNRAFFCICIDQSGRFLCLFNSDFLQNCCTTGQRVPLLQILSATIIMGSFSSAFHSANDNVFAFKKDIFFRFLR